MNAKHKRVTKGNLVYRDNRGLYVLHQKRKVRPYLSAEHQVHPLYGENNCYRNLMEGMLKAKIRWNGGSSFKAEQYVTVYHAENDLLVFIFNADDKSQKEVWFIQDNNL